VIHASPALDVLRPVASRTARRRRAAPAGEARRFLRRSARSLDSPEQRVPRQVRAAVGVADLLVVGIVGIVGTDPVEVQTDAPRGLGLGVEASEQRIERHVLER
jgi:hypothetical protein